MQQQAIGAKPKAATAGKAAFGDILGAFAPLAGELTYQASGSPNAAAVLHAAFSGYGQAFGGARGYSGAVLGDLPGMMGAPRNGTFGGTPYGNASFDPVPGLEGVSQAELIDQMNTNNLQLLELQAVMQNNMQQWNTKSNILKSVHESKMALIQKFTVHQ
ncbi:MAG: hypothetical protein HY543_01970 [Deltaproteobacteria bacterium]|nr:hypothetical protein [Deltaproteobacteria bacterium]